MKYFIKFFGGTHNVMKNEGKEERVLVCCKTSNEALRVLKKIKRNAEILKQP